MIKLNLLPEIKREYLRAKQVERRVVGIAILSMVVAGGLVVVGTLWVYGAQEVYKKLLTDEITKNLTTLKSTKDIDKYVTIQNQLASLDGLHDKKTITSRLFDIVPRLNPKAPNSVKLTSINVDTIGTTIVFEGETTSFTGLQTFRDTLENAKFSYRQDAEDKLTEDKLFSGTVINSQSLATRQETNQTYVSFKVTATYNPTIFGANLKDFSVIVPTKETTQSKQDTPDVFSGNPTGEDN